MGGFARFSEYPLDEAGLERAVRQIEACLQSQPIGAILAEPIQARGGIRIPARRFLASLRRLADQHGALLILDEIYTGFGRTGTWFACEADAITPDLICLGKALTGGFPLSACVGKAEVMDAAWPVSTGEALHTSTFLGHPVGCAMALAQIRELRRGRLVERSRRLGEVLRDRLARMAWSSPRLTWEVRGRGLMVGLEISRRDGQPATAEVMAAVKGMLARGFILLPEGDDGSVIGFTPPLTIPVRDLERAVDALEAVLAGEVR
jgi:4-aminobutyrate aminotransferase-like enzyme